MKSIFVTVTALCFTFAAYSQTTQQPANRPVVADYSKPETKAGKTLSTNQHRTRVVPTTNYSTPLPVPVNKTTQVQPVRKAVVTDANTPAVTR